MPRLIIGLIVAAAVFTVYTVVDCAVSQGRAVRGLPKWAWLLVIVFVPIIGGVLWLIVGRPRRARSGGGARRVTAPDDDPDFLRGIARDREQEERIKRLEQELSELDDGDAETGRRDA